MAPWGGLESLLFIQLFLKEVKKGKKKKRKKDKEAQPAGHRHSETDREKQSERLSRQSLDLYTVSKHCGRETKHRHPDSIKLKVSLLFPTD